MKSYSIMLIVLLILSFNMNSYGQAFCQVSKLTGDAYVVNTDGKTKSLTLFEKIVPGNNIFLKENSLIKLVFLRSGRIEQWNGPANLMIETNESKDVANSQLPVIMQYIAKNSFLEKDEAVKNSNSFSGGQIVIRGKQKAKNDAASQNKDEKDIINEILSKNVDSSESDYSSIILDIELLTRFGEKHDLDAYYNKLKEHGLANTYINNIFGINNSRTIN